MTIKELLGKRIKELRVVKKLTQAQLAELVGIDPKHQSCIENGRNFPSADLLDKFAKVFEVDVCELLKIEQNRSRIYLEEKINKLIKKCSDAELKTVYRVLTSILE